MPEAAWDTLLAISMVVEDCSSTDVAMEVTMLLLSLMTSVICSISLTVPDAVL